MSNTTYRIIVTAAAFVTGVFTIPIFAVIWPFALAAFVCNEIDSESEA